MKRNGDIRREMKRIKGRRGEVEISSQGNEGDRIAIEEDQNEDFLLRFAKRGPTWTRVMWMQPRITQLWSSDTRYSNTRSPRYVRRRRSTSTNIDKR
jgi:hypothetical protein